MNEFFNDLEMQSWGGLVYVQGKIFQHIENDLKINSGITHSEFEVLLRLYFCNGNKARIQDLANASLLSRSGTSRAVTRLLKSGYLKRISIEEDKRGAIAVLTKEGKNIFKKASLHHSRLVREKFLNYFSKDELKMMASLWKKLNL